MVYWDASALVSLCIEEESTQQLQRLLADGIVTWAVSRVEIASAIERRSRENDLSPEARHGALVALGELAEAWTEIHEAARDAPATRGRFDATRRRTRCGVGPPPWTRFRLR